MEIGEPVSSLIAGNRMVTAEVFAFTTNVETHAASNTPMPAALPLFVIASRSDMRPVSARPGPSRTIRRE